MISRLKKFLTRFVFSKGKRLTTPLIGGLTIESIREFVDNPRTLIEIGSNDGSHTRQFAEAFPNAQIYGFEPDARAWANLVKAIESHSNVHVRNIAISDVDGEADFFNSGGRPPELAEETPEWGWDKSGSLCEPTGHRVKHPWCRFEQVSRVKTRTLDTVTAELSLSGIDIIWMDVQGAEKLVLSGAQRSLRFTRFLYTEFSNEELYKGQPNLQEIMSLVPGFSVAALFENDVLLKNDRFNG